LASNICRRQVQAKQIERPREMAKKRPRKTIKKNDQEKSQRNVKGKRL